MREKSSVRSITSMYKLRHRTVNLGYLLGYLFLLTPIITVLTVVLLWFMTGAGGAEN